MIQTGLELSTRGRYAFVNQDQPTQVQVERNMERFKPRMRGRVPAVLWRERSPMFQPLRIPTWEAVEMVKRRGLEDGLAPLPRDALSWLANHVEPREEDDPEWKWRALANQPAGCVGPVETDFKKMQNPRRGYPCGRWRFCLYCWERHKREQAMKGFARFVERPTWKISTNLLAGSDDLKEALEARKAVRDFLVDQGATSYWLFIHATGDSPQRGTRLHIDGLFEQDGKPAWMENRLQFPPMEPWQAEAPSGSYRFHTARVRTDYLNRGHLRHHAGYSGRWTAEPRRLFAGAWDTMTGPRTVGYTKPTPTQTARPVVLEWTAWVKMQLEWEELVARRATTPLASKPEVLGGPERVAFERTFEQGLKAYRLKPAMKRVLEVHS